eukprot:3502900-Pyramimonas_sp.AAC.1
MASTVMENAPWAALELAIEADTVKDHYPGEHSYCFVAFNPTIHSGPDHSGNIAPHRTDAVSAFLPALRAPADAHYI